MKQIVLQPIDPKTIIYTLYPVDNCPWCHWSRHAPLGFPRNMTSKVCAIHEMYLMNKLRVRILKNALTRQGAKIS